MTTANFDKDNKKNTKTINPCLILVAAVALAAFGYYYYLSLEKDMALSQEEVKVKAERFINEKLLTSDVTATITDIIEENGVYKILIDIDGQEATAYVSLDGKNFLPEVLNMDSWQSPQSQQQQAAKEPAEKKDVPDVELFVMSYCPYGLQIEKGILPVLELLGSKINFDLRFVDYALHGEKEINENLQQYCIGQQGFAKLDAYLKCFLVTGSADACLKTAAINSSLLNSCITSVDEEFNITANLNDQTTWKGDYPPFNIDRENNVKYGVEGSPTMVINGTVVAVNRDPQSLLDMICSGFSNLPQECDEQLSSDVPAAGFGEGTEANTTNSANCGG